MLSGAAAALLLLLLLLHLSAAAAAAAAAAAVDAVAAPATGIATSGMRRRSQETTHQTNVAEPPRMFRL